MELAAVREEADAKTCNLENRLAEALEKIEELEEAIQEKDVKREELSIKVGHFNMSPHDCDCWGNNIMLCHAHGLHLEQQSCKSEELKGQLSDTEALRTELEATRVALEQTQSNSSNDSDGTHDLKNRMNTIEQKLEQSKSDCDTAKQMLQQREDELKVLLREKVRKLCRNNRIATRSWIQ